MKGWSYIPGKSIYMIIRCYLNSKYNKQAVKYFYRGIVFDVSNRASNNQLTLGLKFLRERC